MKYLFCIILPPLAVLMAGKKTAFVLNCVLTLCLWVPGIIHAILVVNGAEADRRNRELIEAVNRSGTSAR